MGISNGPTSEYYDRDRPAFYWAIQSVREADLDLTGLLEYFVAGLETQLEEVKERGKQAIRVDVLVKDHALNHRQSAALHLILQQGDLNIQDLEDRFPTLNRRTLQRDLTGLDAHALGAQPWMKMAGSVGDQPERLFSSQ